MKKYLSRPDISLLLMAGLIVAAGATTDSDATVDLHFHDTYYVISIFHLAIVYAVLLVAEAGLYTATSWFRQWRWLQVLHVVSMLLSPLILVVSSGVFTERRYFDYSSESSFLLQPRFLRWWYVTGILIFFAGHLAFLVNIVAGFFRGRKNRMP